MIKRTQLQIEGLGVYRVVDKLERAQIAVLSARIVQKNVITLEVASKDVRTVLAILRGSCYNVKKVRFRGLTLLFRRCLSSLGLLSGALIAVMLVTFAQTRVLKIEITGSGAYYEGEVREILSRNGIALYCAQPREVTSLTAEILSLPRVSFCTVSHSGGILTVDVEVSDENAAIKSESLLAPATGTVEELILVRGTARVQVGDSVQTGDVVVENRAIVNGTEYEVIVIARVTIGFSVRAEYPGTEEEARAAAYLEYGEIGDLVTERTENGWLCSGTVHREASVNLE